MTSSTNPAVRFILNTITSKRDSNGNTQNYVILTSTKTGKRLFIDDCCEGNAISMLNKLSDKYLSYPTIVCINSIVGIRDFYARRRQNKADSAPTQYMVTVEMIGELETL